MRRMGKVPRLYVYKLTTDNGGAPCVQKDLLSLAICKPGIRRVAQVNDWIFGFGGKRLGQRLIYIARVTKRLEKGRYYEDESYDGRGDRIYRPDDERKFVWRNEGKYHKNGIELEHDLGKSPGYERAVTLLSSDFRYWGKKGTADYRGKFPAIVRLVDSLGRGHRVHLSAEVREALRELQEAQWRETPHRMRLGSPTHGDQRLICNRWEGSLGSGRRDV